MTSSLTLALRFSLSDAIHVVYLELSKLQKIMEKPVEDMTDLEKWTVFFQYAGEPTHREMVNEVIASKGVLQMARDFLMSINQDERERAVFRRHRMYQTDLESDLATAEDRGARRGRAEAALSLIRNLMDCMSLSLEQAMAVLKIPESEHPRYWELLEKQ